MGEVSVLRDAQIRVGRASQALRHGSMTHYPGAEPDVAARYPYGAVEEWDRR